MSSLNYRGSEEVVVNEEGTAHVKGTLRWFQGEASLTQLSNHSVMSPMTAWYDITATHFTKGQLQPDSAKHRHFWTAVREAALIVRISPHADFSPPKPRFTYALECEAVRIRKKKQPVS